MTWCVLGLSLSVDVVVSIRPRLDARVKIPSATGIVSGRNQKTGYVRFGNKSEVVYIQHKVCDDEKTTGMGRNARPWKSGGGRKGEGTGIRHRRGRDHTGKRGVFGQT